MFAFPLVGYALTGSAVLAGLPLAAFLLGMVLALLPAGVVVDRTDRKKLMLAASGCGVLVYGSVAVAAGLGGLTIGHLIAAALLTGVGAGVFGPAEASAVRSVVAQDELPTALSQNQARRHMADLVGGPLGAAMYSVSKVLPFVFDAVTFLISFVTLVRIRTDLSPVPRPKRRVRADLAEGLHYVWDRPYFRTMMAFGALSNLAVNAVFFVAILRLVQEGVHPAAIGVIDMLAGLGGILGALAAPYVIDRLPTGRLTLWVAWSWVPLLVPLVFWSSPVLVGAMLMLGILLNPAGNAGTQAYRVAITPPELQGRVGSSMQFVGMSMMPLAPITGGFLLETYGGPAATIGLLVLVTRHRADPDLELRRPGHPGPGRVAAPRRAGPRSRTRGRLNADPPESFGRVSPAGRGSRGCGTTPGWSGR